MALHPALSFSTPGPGPGGSVCCAIAWAGQPIATLYRTDTPEADAWEPGAPGPVRVPGFTCYTVRSNRTGALLSGMDRDAVLDELARRCDPNWPPQTT